jgi:hypothetical protein
LKRICHKCRDFLFGYQCFDCVQGFLLCTLSAVDGCERQNCSFLHFSLKRRGASPEKLREPEFKFTARTDSRSEIKTG